MKQKLLMAAAVVFLIAAGCCLYMETHFTTSTMVDARLSEKQILREMPEIAITEQDMALAAYILSLPQVQERLDRTEPEGLNDVKKEPVPLKEAQALLSDWTEEGWTATEIVISLGNLVKVSFSKDDRTTNVHYVFSADESSPPKKSISIHDRTFFQENACKAIYQNANGEITKMKHKQVWFAWLTGGVRYISASGTKRDRG